MDSKLYIKEELISDTLTFNFSATIFRNYPVTWKDHITSLLYGRCIVASDIGILEAGQFIKVHLNTSIPIRYKLWLHDPDFFMLSLNPNSVPTIDNTLNVSGAPLGVQLFINAEEHYLLNREKSPCSDYQDSSFTKCVENYVITKTNCKVKYF